MGVRYRVVRTLAFSSVVCYQPRRLTLRVTSNLRLLATHDLPPPRDPSVAIECSIPICASLTPCPAKLSHYREHPNHWMGELMRVSHGTPMGQVGAPFRRPCSPFAKCTWCTGPGIYKMHYCTNLLLSYWVVVFHPAASLLHPSSRSF